MSTRRLVSMILAGGRGERLGGLSQFYSKPAIHFGGNHRIIDFTLNNCRNAGIETIGILGQYFTTDLHDYIRDVNGYESINENIYILSSEDAENSYIGTADAVYRNIAFIDRFMPDNVLILAGDHIYSMDYEKMLDFHEKKGADITVSVTPVPIQDASRFGILNAAKDGRVLDFEEKPLCPKSDLASMGIYIFKWSVLKKYLLADSKSAQSHHDFGKNIIPETLFSGERVYAYRFNGYWRDVGTVDSLWEANMDQIDNPAAYALGSGGWGIPDSYASNIMISGKAVVHNSIVSGGCSIFGKLEHSVLSDSVTVGEGAEIVNSVIMPGVHIGNHVKICNSVVGTNAQIMDDATVGMESGLDFFMDNKLCSRGVSLVAPWAYIPESMHIQMGSHIYKDRLDRYKRACDEMSRMKYTDSSIGMYVPIHSN